MGPSAKKSAPETKSYVGVKPRSPRKADESPATLALGGLCCVATVVLFAFVIVGGFVLVLGSWVATGVFLKRLWDFTAPPKPPSPPPQQ